MNQNFRKIINIIILVSVSTCVLGFISHCKKNTRNSGDKILSHTLICSSPDNYNYTLKNNNASGKVEIRSYKDMLELFEKLNYTPEAWQAGIREVPRIYLPLIGERWGSTTSKEMTILLKKQFFSGP